MPALALITLLGVGIRMLIMQSVQQRRERMNRQINERLKTLIAAYRTLGGSFTGKLAVDPTHLRDLRAAQPAADSKDIPSKLKQDYANRRYIDCLARPLRRSSGRPCVNCWESACSP